MNTICKTQCDNLDGDNLIKVDYASPLQNIS